MNDQLINNKIAFWPRSGAASTRTAMRWMVAVISAHCQKMAGSHSFPCKSIAFKWIASAALLLVAAFATARPLAAEDRLDLKRPIRATTDLVFAEVNGEKIRADIYRPDDSTSQPGVLLIHGGAWSAGDKWNMRDHARELAQAGYVAVSINYRLAPKHKYPAQIDDCRSALKWMHQVAGEYLIDTQRLAVYGYSAGGHLAALLATDPIEGLPRIKVAVLGGAPCDLTFVPEDSRVIAHVLGGTRAELPQVYRQASPLTYCTGDDCPTFFFHGQSDLIVPPESSRIMFQRLKDLGVMTQYYSVEKQGHLVSFIHPTARQAAIEFLNKQLRSEP
ncbi:MAG: alpha/beta hydrolase [Pirellulaceae bacterium]|nr:alpha/beta hydrolase [Pirellulaceae bacterium]